MTPLARAWYKRMPGIWPSLPSTLRHAARVRRRCPFETNWLIIIAQAYGYLAWIRAWLLLINANNPTFPFLRLDATLPPPDYLSRAICFFTFFKSFFFFLALKNTRNASKAETLKIRRGKDAYHRSMVYLDCGDRLVIYSRFVSIRARLVTSDVTMSTT